MNGKYNPMKNFRKNKGLVIWLTGLPCSGKTTISKEIEKYFRKKKKSVQRLDGDIVRNTINQDLGFSKEDRDENIKRVTYISQMLAENGVNVIVAFVSPYQKMRNLARKICPNFIEVFVSCDIKECIQRDTKGMYKKALAGKIKDFTGVQDPYEAPKSPEIVLKTDKKSKKESVEQIVQFLEKLLK
jgi:adenylyl-sulfate kinase